MLDAQQITRITPQMDKRFAFHAFESVAEACQTVEYSNRKHQVGAGHVTLIDGCAPGLRAPLTGLEEQSPHLRMDQAHTDGHRKSLGKTGQTVGLTNREYVARRVFQPLRCAMHQLTR